MLRKIRSRPKPKGSRKFGGRDAIIGAKARAERATAKAALTVAGKYRIQPDGNFQLWNATQGKWHTLAISGEIGAEVITINVSES